MHYVALAILLNNNKKRGQGKQYKKNKTKQRGKGGFCLASPDTPPFDLSLDPPLSLLSQYPKTLILSVIPEPDTERGGWQRATQLRAASDWAALASSRGRSEVGTRAKPPPALSSKAASWCFGGRPGGRRERYEQWQGQRS